MPKPPTDQNHEQVNKDLKGSGGISDLLNTSGSLEQFLIAGPIVAKLIQDFECPFFKWEDFDTMHHHSEFISLQKRFSDDCKKPTETLLKIGNPFTEPNNITSLVSKKVSSCSQNIVEIEKLSKEQFETYLQSVFVEKTASIVDTITKTKSISSKQYHKKTTQQS